ncbi:hypothetical protein BS47DRAFT_1375143 [Hydnum rufescens UP504]|uniref:MFS general substrate transporter n=1 Tax=Hydnum rufescens UP504 TaxID=1448309 RepID=A0A9P6B7J5_9AGAM|nr:hypothetical protein BS47DRAFT_1375143 [Hydnum rufescens UP504]
MAMRKESVESSSDKEDPPSIDVYKRRWVGLVGLILLNISAGMGWLWFAPISVQASSQLGMSLTKINWLNNLVNLTYVPVSLLCIGASCVMVIGAWIRYSATPRWLSPHSVHALLFLGQLGVGLAQPVFQVLAPKYSELWFDLKSRTTATALISVANPFGGALGELISPLIDNVRTSILILAIINSVLGFGALLISTGPPTPPTFSGSKPSVPMMEVLRACVRRPRVGELVMNRQQSLDFFIVTLLFAVLVAGANSFFILVNQIFEPYGYSSDAAGNMGGAMIIAGLIGAFVAAPLIDRVFTRHLALTAKIIVPVLSVAWLSLIWDVRPNNYGGLYPVFVVLGVGSFVLLPVALEIGCEVTSSPETSSAVFWCAANALTVVFVELMDTMRAGPDAHPPRNMNRSLVFLGSLMMVSHVAVYGLTAHQTRRETDAAKASEAAMMA